MPAVWVHKLNNFDNVVIATWKQPRCVR